MNNDGTKSAPLPSIAIGFQLGIAIREYEVINAYV